MAAVLATLAQVKAALEIVADATQDAYLQRQIDAATAEIGYYTGRELAQQNYRDTWRAPVGVVALSEYPVAEPLTLVSSSTGTISDARLSPGSGLVMPGTTQDWTGQADLAIEYTAGYAAVPPAALEALYAAVWRRWEPYSDASEQFAGEAVRRLQLVDIGTIEYAGSGEAASWPMLGADAERLRPLRRSACGVIGASAPDKHELLP